MDAQDCKQLIFTLNNGYYGFPILTVKEVIGMVTTVHIPHVPSFIKGVINLRGKILPVMDLRIKFGMPEESYNERTCIVIVETLIHKEKRQLGIVVDGISEVIDINPDEIEPPPEYDEKEDCGFLKGIAKLKGKVVMLLDVEQIVNYEDVANFLAVGKEKVPVIKEENIKKVAVKK